MKKIMLCLMLNLTLVQAENKNTEFIKNALQGNSIDEHIVAGLIAKIFKLPYSNEQLYAKVITLAPDNILLLEQIIRFCDGDSQFCKKHENFVKHLEKIDSENAVPNLYAAVYYEKNNQSNKAFKYLSKGADKTVFDDYNWDRFFLVSKTLLNNGYTINNAYQIASHSIYMGHDFEPIVKIMNICAKQSKNNLKWKNKCIQFGKMIEVSSKMVLSTFVGFGIQRDVLALEKADMIEYENVKQRRDVFHQFRLRAVKNIEYAAGLNEKTDFDRVPEVFFKDLEKFGEKVAVHRALNRLNSDTGN